MKLLLALIFLVNISFGQSIQEISLCDFIKREYTYFIFNQEIDLKWITPYGITYDKSVTVEWNTPGTFAITAEYIDQYTCNYQKRFFVVKVLECDKSTIFFPNSFTPNGDYTNDLFEVKGYNIKKYQLLIYNRWGELVYESNSLSDMWDGYYKKYMVQEDVYVYKALWQDIKSKWGFKTGTVTVLY